MKVRATEIAFFEEWLKGKNLADSSIYQYVRAVKKFIMLDPDVEDIEVYNNFILEYAIRKRSCYYYDSLVLFVKYIFNDNQQKKNSMLKLLLKPDQNNDVIRTRRFLDNETRDQVIKLLKIHKHRIIAKLQNETGVRAGDIIRLKRGSISYEPYEDKQVVMRIDFVGKGGRHFVKWVFDDNLQFQIDLFIKNYLLDEEYYFLERDKGNNGSSFTTLYRTNYHHYWSDLKQALDMLGVAYKDFATHDFRRNFARKIWSVHKDPVILKEVLNHARFDTTLRYLRNSGLQTRDVYYEMNQIDHPTK